MSFLGTCDICNKQRIVSISKECNKPVCDRCRRKDPGKLERCYFCKKRRIVAGRYKGWAVCPGCQRKIRKKEECSKCGHLREVAFRTEDKKPVCHPCYNIDESRHEVCCKCRKKKPVCTRDDHGRAICSNCHKKNPNRKERCSKCRRLKLVGTRGQNGEPICASCNIRDKSKHEKCSVCGKIKYVAKRGKMGEPICTWCSKPRRTGICFDCRGPAIIYAKDRCWKHYRIYWKTQVEQRFTRAVV